MTPAALRGAAEKAAAALCEGLTERPVDLTAMAEQLDAQVHRSHSTGTEAGFAANSQDLGRIVCTNSKLSEVRQRFALAHALGHLKLHPKRELTVCKTMRVDEHANVTSVATMEQEAEASQFALALLMPEPWLRELVAVLRESNLPREQLIRRVANAFAVSTTAAIARCYGLGIFTS